MKIRRVLQGDEWRDGWSGRPHYTMQVKTSRRERDEPDGYLEVQPFKNTDPQADIRQACPTNKEA